LFCAFSDLIMLSFDAFSDVIAGIYDASMDVERWPQTLALLGQGFDCERAQVAFGSPTNAHLSFWRLWNLVDEISPEAFARFAQLSVTDPRMSTVRYKAVHCRQVVSEEALRASQIYREALAPARIEYSMYFSVPVDEEGLCLLSVMRPPGTPVFTDEDCATFGRFVPHVARALEMHNTIHRIREQVAAARALLDGVPLAMMVVKNADVTIANKAARTLLDEGDAISYRQGRLRAATPSADAQLREAIGEASAGGDQSVAVTLPVENADDPVRCVIRKLNPASAGMLGSDREAVALYLSDPRKPIETPGEILQRLFGLTPREAAVLHALVQGKDIAAVANDLAISPDTVRVHLKHIMQSTGATRQADLVRLVLSSPAWFGNSGGPPGSP
jgi:DNA-binding CsgD family transcriptional regulator